MQFYSIISKQSVTHDFQKWAVLLKTLFGTREWMHLEAWDCTSLPIHMTDRCLCATRNMLTQMDHQIRVEPGIIILGCSLPHIGKSTNNNWPPHDDTVRVPYLLFRRKDPLTRRNLHLMPKKFSKFSCSERVYMIFS